VTDPSAGRRRAARAALGGATLYALLGALLAVLAIDKRHFPFAGAGERLAIVAWWAAVSAPTGAILGWGVGLLTAPLRSRGVRVVAGLVLLVGAATGMVHAGRRAGRQPVVRAASRGDVPAGGDVAARAVDGAKGSGEGGPGADDATRTGDVARPDAPNLVLLTVDTLRADHLGLHGYDRATSPTLDAFAARGAVFELAIAPAPATLRSVASMHTGLLPTAADPTDRSPFLDAGFRTLAERLADGGYATGAFVTNAFLAASNGFAQGFDAYHEDFVDVSGAAAGPPTIDDVLDPALAWIADAPRPFFAWIHAVDTHHPYAPEEAAPWEDVDSEAHRRLDAAYRGLTVAETTARLRALSRDARPPPPSELEYLVGRYDAAVLQVDRGLARLLAGLDAAGLDDATVVVVTSDHGEELGDHGRLLHGHTLFDELLHVPLVMGGPGVPAGARVGAQVRLLDVGPTLLDLAGLAADDLHGRSLLPTLEGRDAAPRPSVSVREDKEVALRTEDAKLVVAHRPYESAFAVLGPWDMGRVTFGRRARGRIGLWRTAEDPGETRDVLGEDRDLARRLYDQLQALRRAHPPDGLPVTNAAHAPSSDAAPGLSPEERAALEALGYGR